MKLLFFVVVALGLCGNTFPEMPTFDVDPRTLGFDGRRAALQVDVDIEKHMESLKKLIDKDTGTGRIEPGALKAVDKRFPICGSHIVYHEYLDDVDGRLYVFEGVDPTKYLIIKMHFDDEWDHEEGWYTPSNLATVVTDGYGQKHLCGRNGMKSPGFAFLESMETSYNQFGSEFKPPITIIFVFDGTHYAGIREAGLSADDAARTVSEEENFSFMAAKYLREIMGVTNAMYWGELGFVQSYDALGYAITQVVRTYAAQGVPGFEGFENFLFETNQMSLIGVKANGAFAMNYSCTGAQKQVRLARTIVDIEDNVYPSQTCVTDPAKNPVLLDMWVKATKSVSGVPGVPPGTPKEYIVAAILPILAQVNPPAACQLKFGSFAATNDATNEDSYDESMYPSSFTNQWQSEFYYTHPATEKSEQEYIAELTATAAQYGCSATHFTTRSGIPTQNYPVSPMFTYINEITKALGLVDSVATPFIFSGAPDVWQFSDICAEQYLFTPKLVEFDPYGQLSITTHQHEVNECISFNSQLFMINWYYAAIHSLGMLVA
jgi:hypothetical protein